jgi:hypothetical protein
MLTMFLSFSEDLSATHQTVGSFCKFCFKDASGFPKLTPTPILRGGGDIPIICLG